jgi:HAE1 family hydrophobic/amphiphilic exporter-1
MALTISTGFVVDDAIVVLENIMRHVEAGMSRMQATLLGAKEVGFTVLSMSISLVAVFIPILLMGGIIGRLFREFAITLSVAIIVSLAVSLTTTPMMCALFLRRPKSAEEGEGWFGRTSERAFGAVHRGYERSLGWALDHALVTLGILVATLCLNVFLFIEVPKGFFPQQDTGLITGQSEAAQDISFADMVRHQQILGDIVRKDPDVAHVAMSIGGSSALNSGRMYVTLKPGEERHATADQIIARLQAQLSKVQGAKLFLQAAQDLNVGGRSSKTQYQFTLQSSDLNELNTWAPKLLEKMKSLPELRDVATDQQTSGTTLSLTVDRNQAARYGITPDLIDATLYDAFGQRQIAQYFTQISTYEVIMEVLPSLQGDVGTLQKLYVTSPLTGGQVPLSVFARWTTDNVKPLSISHQGQFPAITLSFNLAPGVALGEATTAVAQAEAEIGMPATINSTFQGNAQAFQDSLSTVPTLIVAALIVVYLILGMLYESYIHPLTILSTLPSAGVGALATLMLFGFDFSLIALIGIILLIGIVKKNGIMLVDFAIAAERDLKMSPIDAIRRACLLRFRPILMTTMAALLGGVPLMLGTGTGSEIRQPLGYAIVGGLLVSQILTLFTTPVIYLYLESFSQWLGKFSGSSPAEEIAIAGAQNLKRSPSEK